MTAILGINAFHGDSSACLVIDGEIVAAVEEERFRRIKHWAGFPTESIRWCLAFGGLNLGNLDVVAINQDSSANMGSRLWYTLRRRPSPGLILEKVRTRGQRSSLADHLADAFPGQIFSGELMSVEHHEAHLASTFFPSGFDEAWAVSIDGFGDFASGAWGYGLGSQLNVESRVMFPHSLGAFYQAFTQYLGFPNYGDEYKVMGLAPYGSPTYVDQLRDVVLLEADGGYRLNLDYFKHHRENVMFEWDSGSPTIGTMYADKMAEVFGPVRAPEEELTRHHKDLAHSVQAMYEEALFHLLNTLHKKTPSDHLAVAGGCGMNSVANGKIRRRTGFKRVFVQAAAGDAGGAIGAALVAAARLGQEKFVRMSNAYLGPSFTQSGVESVIEQQAEGLSDFDVTTYDDDSKLCAVVAGDVAEGLVVGWFHGALEWGPRALGHRSIVGDPRRADMKDILNVKIKRRESFRPFAPSVLREAVADWFEEDDDVPFMMKVFQIREEKRSEIPAVTHVDGSGRLQTVSSEDNGRYYKLISAFHGITGVPMVLNTSFNENEPIVCTPGEALDCFLRTNMDVLVLENTVIRRA